MGAGRGSHALKLFEKGHGDRHRCDTGIRRPRGARKRGAQRGNGLRGKNSLGIIETYQLHSSADGDHHETQTRQPTPSKMMMA